MVIKYLKCKPGQGHESGDPAHHITVAVHPLVCLLETAARQLHHTVIKSTKLTLLQKENCSQCFLNNMPPPDNLISFLLPKAGLIIKYSP